MARHYLILIPSGATRDERSVSVSSNTGFAKSSTHVPQACLDRAEQPCPDRFPQKVKVDCYAGEYGNMEAACPQHSKKNASSLELSVADENDMSRSMMMWSRRSLA